MCFCLIKRKPQVKPAKFFCRVGAASAELLQHFLKADPKEELGAPKPTDYRQAQMQTKGYIKSGGEQTAHRRLRKR